jgi:hypothetical protein
MAWAKEIMQGGLSPQTAKSMAGGANAAVSAAGTTAGTATTIGSSMSIITTAAASSGVRLPSLEIGDETEILNVGANAVIVYPASGERINGLATDASFLLATNTAVRVRKMSSTRNAAYLSA